MAKKGIKRRGLFITFEGPEGCGKSTHAKLLCNYLRRLYCDCLLTREPGGTKTGEKIRKLLLHSKGIKISDLTELFLFEAARAQIVSQIIAPNMKKGKIVICDRFSDATFCYQGYGGKVPLRSIKAVDDVATKGLRPDLTILLDVDTSTGLKRAKRKGTDRMESKDIAYHKRVRSGYLALARKESKRIKIVRVKEDIKETQQAIRRVVSGAISKYKRSR